MGKIIKKGLPCLSKACGSSDAMSQYEDKSYFCFSCKEFFPKIEGDEPVSDDFVPVSASRTQKPDKSRQLAEILESPIRGFQERGISKAVCEFYGVRASYDSSGVIDTHYYPYDDNTAFKIRKLPKEFTWIGKSISLFGIEKFQGGGKRVLVSEGEIDALTLAQTQLDKYGRIYPSVGLSSAVMTKSLIENRAWLRTFDEVVLCFDNDEAGQKALEEAIKIIGLDKVKIAKLPEKDPNEVFKKHGSAKLLQCIYDAQPHTPSGIITKAALWEAIVAYNNMPSVLYPPCLQGVNKKTKGARTGEIALFVSGTSCGKSTVMREIMLHFSKVTPDKVGIVSLEEAPAETGRKLAGMELQKNPAKEEIPLAELQVGFDKVFDTDKFIILDHQGSLKDDNILDKLEYMALSGCKWIVIDHITILVSEGAGNLQGNEAVDKVMNDLLRFVKRHNVWIGLVSHLRKTPNQGKAFEEGEMPNLDDIKGSGSIKQISFDIIAFARNLQDTDPIKRNTIRMAVLKSRYTGLTGPVEGAWYDYDTGRFNALEHVVVASEDFKQVTPPQEIHAF